MTRRLRSPIPGGSTTAGSVIGMRGPLGIGITGHRPERLAACDLGALRATIDAVLQTVIAAAPSGSSFRLISNLAEGADSLVTDATLAKGWMLDAVLPFAREEYARDFKETVPKAALEAHLARARSVLELDGRRDEPGGSAGCYERAGRVMLTQSDLLIAIWHGDPPRGRGGAAQIVNEAVAQGVPVLWIDPSGTAAPSLLWSGLNNHDFGMETVATIAHGSLSDLPRLFAVLTAPAPPIAEKTSRLAGFIRPVFSSAYPLLLAIIGVRRFRRADLATGALPFLPPDCVDDDTGPSFTDRVASCLQPRFAQADGEASRIAQLFRSAYVTNFSLAALGVLLSLLELALPRAVKPLLVASEFAAIATILIVTRVGGRSRWHARWLANRQYAERLRCLALSARFGDLALRSGGAACHVARTLGLPSTRVDQAFLRDGRKALIDLLEDQLAYLVVDARRMHRLEHRLHRLGGLLFTLTAGLCLLFLFVECLGLFRPDLISEPSHAALVAGTIVSAAFPAIGASIYGIRMQGDFAGVAERNTALAEQLRHLLKLASDDAADFDLLRRLSRRLTELMTLDVSQWRQAYEARPLALPG